VPAKFVIPTHAPPRPSGRLLGSVPASRPITGLWQAAGAEQAERRETITAVSNVEAQLPWTLPRPAKQPASFVKTNYPAIKPSHFKRWGDLRGHVPPVFIP